MVCQYRLTADEAIVQQRADRHVFPCWGIFDGKPGALSKSYFVRDGKREEAPSKFVQTMRQGETFRAEMAGSGGYGEPFERDPHAVAEDVRQEKLSANHAKIEYGVIVDSNALLDIDSTSALRQNKGGPAK